MREFRLRRTEGCPSRNIPLQASTPRELAELIVSVVYFEISLTCAERMAEAAWDGRPRGYGVTSWLLEPTS